MNLTSQTISDDQWDSIFNSTPDGTPKLGDVDGTDIKDPKEKDKDKAPDPNPELITDKDQLTDEDWTTIFNDTDDATDGDKTKDKDKAKDKPKPDPQGADTNVLKSTLGHLIKKGMWYEWDGWEDEEINEENFGDIAEQQHKAIIDNLYQEKLESLGDKGKAIIEYIEAGGDPDNIISVFKDIEKGHRKASTKEEKIADIRDFYKKVKGLKDYHIDKMIDQITVDETIDDEYEEIEQERTVLNAERIKKEQEDLKAYNAEQTRRKLEFSDKIKKVVEGNKNLTDGEKRKVQDSILNFDQKLPNGSLVNKFFIKFAEIQNNTEEYIELVRFVMDKENYLKKIDKQAQTTADRNAFKLIKGNQTIDNRTGSGHLNTTTDGRKPLNIFG